MACPYNVCVFSHKEILLFSLCEAHFPCYPFPDVTHAETEQGQYSPQEAPGAWNRVRTRCLLHQRSEGAESACRAWQRSPVRRRTDAARPQTAEIPWIH